jgi:hypothetical protein
MEDEESLMQSVDVVLWGGCIMELIYHPKDEIHRVNRRYGPLLKYQMNSPLNENPVFNVEPDKALKVLVNLSKQKWINSLILTQTLTTQKSDIFREIRKPQRKGIQKLNLVH